MRRVLVFLFCFLFGCTKSEIDINYVLMINKALTSDETRFALILNDYRTKLGKSTLKCDLTASNVIEEHIDWMLAGGISHIGDKTHADRLEYLMSKGVKDVGEILGRKYRMPQTAFNAFLNSATHRRVIEGNYDAFGISIKQDISGVKYYGIIFIKI